MGRAPFFLAVAAVAALFLLVGAALAMSSANYRLDWFTPLSGSGGPASSASYAINVTVGQSAIGVSDGSSYAGCLGYWGYWCSGAGPGPRYSIYLPQVVRGFP